MDYGHLCSDELKIGGVNGEWIECSGWDAASSQEVSLRVNIYSGKLAG
jgi:hypothetical protein